ncbi:MAG TPA: iron-sulfur cluster repair di-iron protein, ric [Eubacteriaceae bacterium]|nr:iron-sulfur cluster repair di-iron protein, ric [Eubacteriaceae bacterium]
MKKFNEAVEKNLERLEQYIPVVARVHGGSHPEFHEVKRVFDKVSVKIKKSVTEKPDLDKEFKELGKITDNYLVPSDVCESYEAVYNMLEELEKAYQE